MPGKPGNKLPGAHPNLAPFGDTHVALISAAVVADIGDT